MSEKCSQHEECFRGVEEKISSLKASIDENKNALAVSVEKLIDKLDVWTRKTDVQHTLILELVKKVDRLEEKNEQIYQDHINLKTRVAFVAGTISLITSLFFLILKKFL